MFFVGEREGEGGAPGIREEEMAEGEHEASVRVRADGAGEEKQICSRHTT